MLKFTKIEGAGNDFIVIDDRARSFSLDELAIRKLCHRNLGVGADGLILLQQEDLLRMRIFNCDGRETQGCGNGLRCLGRFLLQLGFPPQNTQIRMGDRIVEIFYSQDKIGVHMGSSADLRLHIATEKGIVHFVNTGVPHVVHFMDAIDQAPLHELGPYWRHHPQFFPQGANVNLAKLEKGRICVRTFERGVEGETLACGTGACAVAAIAHALYSIPSPMTLSFAGGELQIQIENSCFAMIGPAVKVFDGLL